MVNVSRWLFLALTLSSCTAAPGRPQDRHDMALPDLSASDDNCAGPADCPANQACDGTSHKCSSACTDSEPCNGGCCHSGTCASGQLTAACGSAGAACVDCSASSLGGVCTAGGCGCDGPNDCPNGAACDSNTHQCVTSCSATQPCHGACCNNGVCASGTSTTVCGASGALCADCTGNSAGSACLGGSCGCNSSSDCAAGQACDTTSHQCSGSCAGGQTCNGGCCDGTNCVNGTNIDHCGSGGGMCQSCGAGAGAVCEAVSGGGACGCDVTNDCPIDQACDTGAHTCTTSCTLAQPCHNGCCAGGTCNAGTGPSTCGAAGGACLDCTLDADGHACVSGGCGCNSASDCPGGTACDTTTNKCTNQCSATQPCNGGCCSSGQCVAGTTLGVCGDSGGLCADCNTSSMGALCLATGGGGSCGCNNTGDCPSGSSCNLAMHQCVTSCNASQPCSGGCCNAGTCSVGASPAACGPSSGTCNDCTGAAVNQGHLCINFLCGCNSAADCSPGLACDTSLHQCTSSCSASQPCHGGCCDSGVCVAGTADQTCGASGGACTPCSTSPAGEVCLPVAGGGACGCGVPSDCPNFRACNVSVHTCTTSCNPSQACNGGCCQGGTCNPGNSTPTCGLSGLACLDCSGSSDGTACVAGGCGCNGPADCPAQQSCDLSTHLCTSNCNPVQPCNGGCCLSGTCAAGTDPAACGNSGGSCQGCAGNGLGSSCVLATGGGTCGCNNKGDCSSGAACDTGAHICTTGCSLTQPCNGACCSNGVCNGGTAPGACGAAGTVCLDCTGSSDGHQCLASVCGCNVTNDCPVGEACDTGTHKCTTSCGPSQLCNGGCCNGGTCSVGTDQIACGATGGACDDCLGDPSGTLCLLVSGGGKCGCTQTTDCAIGSACNRGNNTCTTSCNPSQLCNGGCCHNGVCGAGTDPGTCGGNGNTCLDCTASSSGHACVAGGCGCNTTADCPNTTACDLSTHLCTNVCNAAQPCNHGCCTDPAAGVCVTGFAAGACGDSGGTCEPCSSAGQGHVCLVGTNGGHCGCNTSGDCSQLQSCQVSANTCTQACNGGQLCNGGCCASGTCNGGTNDATCGANGQACIDCSTSVNGHRCLTGTTCGCNVAGDCPTGQSCNTVSHTCSGSCGNANQTACNGGCCQGGTCNPGNTPGSCGIDGNSCNNCGIGADTCTSTAACRCGINGACPAGQQCVSGMCQCTSTSCPNGCCASGSCLPSAFANCGLNGVGCIACSMMTADNCTAGGCRCGSGNPCNLGQQCVSGMCQCNSTSCNSGCCASNSCQSGNTTNACGTGGLGCQNCQATFATNAVCLSPPQTCGCPSGMRLCGALCIPNGSCCTNSDCSGISGSICPAPGGSCTCPSGTNLCQPPAGGKYCISPGTCCSTADCGGIAGDVCPAPGGTCACSVSGQVACNNNKKCYTPGTGKCCVNGDCSAPNSSSDTCNTNNSCVLNCNSGWVDVNGSFGDGCECPDEGGSHDCAHFVDLGSLGLNSSIATQFGRLPFTNEERWYRINFTSAPTPGHYAHVDISSDDGTFRVDVYRGSSCGTLGLTGCASEGGNSFGLTSWDLGQVGDTNGIHCGSSTVHCNSTCNCTWPAYNQLPAAGLVFIRVRRNGGAASCFRYALNASD
jgi:hypothetical protein